ncbi:MAG: hypothetical protein OZ917_05545 [Candidatus Brocadiaceae bacterium]|nr:hypothetical protein [Candidatus Brocadiaceae bacterium]
MRKALQMECLFRNVFYELKEGMPLPVSVIQEITLSIFVVIL